MKASDGTPHDPQRVRRWRWSSAATLGASTRLQDTGGRGDGEIKAVPSLGPPRGNASGAGPGLPVRPNYQQAVTGSYPFLGSSGPPDGSWILSEATVTASGLEVSGGHTRGLSFDLIHQICPSLSPGWRWCRPTPGATGRHCTLRRRPRTPSRFALRRCGAITRGDICGRPRPPGDNRLNLNRQPPPSASPLRDKCTRPS